MSEPTMKPTIRASILAVGLTVAPFVCSAASIGPYHHVFFRAHTPAPTTPPLPLMDLTPRKPLVRPYERLGAVPQEDRVPTVVSYKPFANGPVGSVGLVHLTASHALDSSALGNASAGQPGAPSQTVGANLAYNFR
jgi:hypothetical protein